MSLPWLLAGVGIWLDWREMRQRLGKHWRLPAKMIWRNPGKSIIVASVSD